MLARLLKRLLHRESAGRPVHGQAESPSHAGWQQRALQLRAASRHREVEALCRQQLQQQPDDVDAMNFLAAALLAQGQAQAGIECLRRAITSAPSAEAYRNLAAILAARGDADGAIENYRVAVRLQPALGDAWNALAALLKALGRYDEAEECCRRGLEHHTHAALRHTLAAALFEQGRVDEAMIEIRAALALNPDAPGAHSDLLRMLSYADGQDPVAVYREHRAWAARHAQPLERTAPPHSNDPDPNRPLRVGYVSPYISKHAVTFFLESVIQHHDRRNFEIFLYADVAQPDEYSQRLQQYGAHWRATLSLTDSDLAQRVREDAIDVLIDLSGHTSHNRLLAFARRPAPVQVNWLGFPSTTGMDSMDYRITDAYCDPPGMTEHLNSESLVRLPGIYMAWRPPDNMPVVGALPALANRYVTFGSFHSCFKITPSTAALWRRILQRVPDSKLRVLAVSSEGAQRHVRALLTQDGIAPERIQFLSRLAFDEYLAEFGNVDIALDTFPYHGATTTCFALWMGLPVIALAGRTHASRADVSMLNNAGLPQLVADSSDEYVEIAGRMAADLNSLAAMRADLRPRMSRSPNTDGASCARDLEDALRQMWITWCAKEKSS